MRYALALLIVLSGCVGMEPDKTKAEFEKKKETLEREIEILRLTKRKILLQNQLEDLETNPKPENTKK